MINLLLENNAILYLSTNSLEKNKLEKEYLEYIKDHVSNVKKAFSDYMVPLLDKVNVSSILSDDDLKSAIRIAEQNIDIHDASKYSDIEFDPYRRFHYRTKDEIEFDNENPNGRSLIDEEYEEAWKHHRENNPHHPEYWVDTETGINKDMTLDAIIEMICDWEAVSMHFNESTLKWYQNNADDEKKAFSSRTKEIVEDLLYNVLYK